MWSTSLVDNWAISNHQVLFVGRLRSEPSSLDNAPFAICQLSFATEHRQLIEHVASKRCAREEFHDVYHLHGWGWSPAELFHRFSPSNIGANSLALLLRGRHNSQNLLKEGHVETQANGGPTSTLTEVNQWQEYFEHQFRHAEHGNPFYCTCGCASVSDKSSSSLPLSPLLYAINSVGGLSGSHHQPDAAVKPRKDARSTHHITTYVSYICLSCGRHGLYDTTDLNDNRLNSDWQILDNRLCQV